MKVVYSIFTLWLLSTVVGLGQQVGIYQTYAIVNVNGSGNQYRYGTRNDDNSNIAFDGSTYGSATNSIYLNGGEVKTFKNGSGNVTGAFLTYRVYRVGTAPGGFTELNLPFNQDLGGGNQKWTTTNAAINIADGQPSGDYTLEVYWRISTNEGDRFDSNNGNNYKASFTVTPTTLPVTLLSFSAKVAGSMVSLDWTTAAETNNAQFTVERSADAVAFLPVGRVSGKGTTTVRQSYQFTDEAPLAGVNYYRLKQTDLDGRFSYSPTRATIVRPTGELTVLGNPVATDLTVTGIIPGSATELRDLTGRLQFQQTATDSRMQVDVRQLPVGTYLLRVVEPTGVQVKRVLVAR